MYPVDTTDREIGYFAAWTASNANQTFGNLTLDATTTQLHGTFARAAGGTFSDSFTITRDVPNPPADRDRDGVADTVDLCPTRPGPASRRGCPTTFTGTAAANTITGSPFNDTIWGLAGHDVLRGGLGSDRLYGGIGRDTLIGDAGNDILVGGTQRDTFWGGKGDDVISSRDGMREVVTCGAGTDRVIADRLDVVRGCEKVTRR
jgi:Ca2+-binding RTX toxin-like protein